LYQEKSGNPAPGKKQLFFGFWPTYYLQILVSAMFNGAESSSILPLIPKSSKKDISAVGGKRTWAPFDGDGDLVTCEFGHSSVSVRVNFPLTYMNLDCSLQASKFFPNCKNQRGPGSTPPLK
jgi:hypothetical protein